MSSMQNFVYILCALFVTLLLTLFVRFLHSTQWLCLFRVYFTRNITHKVHARFCTELFGNRDFQVTGSVQNRVFVCNSAGTLVIITLLLILFRNLSAIYPIRFEL